MLVSSWKTSKEERDVFKMIHDELQEEMEDLENHLVDLDDQEAIRKGFEMSSKIYKGEAENNQRNRSVVCRGLTVARTTGKKRP